MSCDERQYQVSLLIDAELEEEDQAPLFKHLEGCPECRTFLDSMIRFRRGVGRDIRRIDDDTLTAWSPVPGRRGTLWTRLLAGGLRLSGSLAAGIAVIILLGGILIGSRIGSSAGGGGGQARIDRPAVAVVCGMPEIEVIGDAPRR